MSPGHLKQRRAISVAGMGRDEIDGRIDFGQNKVVVLLDFGLEPIDDLDVLESFALTQKPVDLVSAALDWFKERVTELLAGD